ncbi:CopG family transcriptional regulator [Candidatus Woesearchaeota archaeon]|nr:CopG family transcriptional regulator [Candidatus Woesearchaeota archaeon]
MEILLPSEVLERIQKKIGNQSISHYLLTLIEKDLQENQPYTENDEEKVKERLRSLGYID